MVLIIMVLIIIIIIIIITILEIIVSFCDPVHSHRDTKPYMAEPLSISRSDGQCAAPPQRRA